MQENGAVNKITCESNYLCWGSGECNLFLNTSESCYDGGDCLYQDIEMSRCNDINCCKGFELTSKGTNPPFETSTVSISSVENTQIVWKVYVVSCIIFFLSKVMLYLILYFLSSYHFCESTYEIDIYAP